MPSLKAKKLRKLSSGKVLLKLWRLANSIMPFEIPIHLKFWVVVIGRCSCLPSRSAALRHHARGAHLYDNATPVPDHMAVRNL
jgi:hypothetical protein